MQDDKTPIVFIGSGEASVLERKVLIHSIRKHARSPVKIWVFNGTHNSLETENSPPVALPMSLTVKYLNITEFSNYRFLIPQLCGFAGRAIYLDSDMICLSDIGELFNADMAGAHFLAKPFKGPRGDSRWGLSVSLFDCERCRFDVDHCADEIASGLYLYNDLHQMTPAFLSHHPFAIGAIDVRWNDFDHHDTHTKLIHYTNLYTQPWKFRGHRHGALWFSYLREARDAGAVSDADIDLAIRRGYVRPDLREGNTLGIGAIVRTALIDFRAHLRERSSGVDAQ